MNELKEKKPPRKQTEFTIEEQEVLCMVITHYEAVKEKYPNLSVFWILSLLRENRSWLQEKLHSVYERYGHTNFCIRHLSKEDVEEIERSVLELRKEGGVIDV